MQIERIDGDTRTVYHFSVQLDEARRQVLVRSSGASISTRTSPRAGWKSITNISRENRGDRDHFVAYDYHGRHGEPRNHRDCDLQIPDDVWAEALAGFEIVKAD
jgi:hypothetical protein